ncbi:MAG: hypothetical protein H6502_05540 [Candidatus Woesearchaeota archaeon]|nr:MAG: hypothetical protein H6502_05540 [Candidatus Woesearchaeota archaeon]
MLEAGYFKQILDLANVFISLFVLLYAYSFLQKTNNVRDRRPWVWLTVATMIFFIAQVLHVMFPTPDEVLISVKFFLQTTFIGMVLFVFIFQYDMIVKSELILITKKATQEEELLENIKRRIR